MESNSVIAAWGSDLHLNFLSEGSLRKFLKGVGSLGLPALLSGDISDGPRLERHLARLGAACPGSVFFVLGNHDYYHSGFDRTEGLVRRAVRETPNLVYLPDSGVTALLPGVGLIGPDLWCDGRISPDLESVPFHMNDFAYIEELKCVAFDRQSLREVIRVMQAKADSGVASLEKSLKEAVSRGFDRVIVLSHTAPLAAMDPCPSELSPFYVCKAAGDLLMEFTAGYPGVKFLWLSGHTHCESRLQVRPNVLCASLRAQYENPRLSGRVYEDLSVSLGREGI